MMQIKGLNHKLSKERLEMFSDGVMAIAITLLILEIKIPKHEDVHLAGGLYNYLLKLWPSYIAYIITFLQVGIYWSNHHWLFTFIKSTNHVFNMLNVVFLMTISFMPFTTAILGEYFTDPEYHNAAVTTYSIGLMLPVVAICLVVFYAGHKHKLVKPGLKQSFLNELYIKLISGLVLICVAVALSFTFPKISMGIILGSFLMYLMPPSPPEYDTVAPEKTDH